MEHKPLAREGTTVYDTIMPYENGSFVFLYQLAPDTLLVSDPLPTIWAKHRPRITRN